MQDLKVREGEDTCGDSSSQGRHLGFQIAWGMPKAGATVSSIGLRGEISQQQACNESSFSDFGKEDSLHSSASPCTQQALVTDLVC